MGEVPILTVSAQVFQIDHETKKKWIPLTQQPAPVSFYHDGTKETYRIICIDDNKVIINCFVMQKMKFLKTSQKFGQWVDSQAATLYGVGFSTESELIKFAEKFEEIKILLGTRMSKSSESSPSLRVASTTNEPDVVGTSVNGLAAKFQKQANTTDTIGGQGITSVQSGVSKTVGIDAKCTNAKCSSVLTFLRAENDRLKLELAQSSSKAKEWEAEMHALRNNNVTLTTALEESRRSAGEWQKQLKSYDGEILEATNKLRNMESVVAQLDDARDRLKEAERISVIKQEELIKLQQQYNEFKRIDKENQKMASKLQGIETENFKLKAQLKELSSQLEQSELGKRPNHNRLQKLQEEISNKINDLYAMNDELAEELQAYL